MENVNDRLEKPKRVSSYWGVLLTTFILTLVFGGVFGWVIGGVMAAKEASKREEIGMFGGRLADKVIVSQANACLEYKGDWANEVHNRLMQMCVSLGRYPVSVVGSFEAVDGGGWQGVFRTLGLEVPVEIRPHLQDGKCPCPNYDVYARGVIIGSGHESHRLREKAVFYGKEFVQIRIDDPSFRYPFKGGLLEFDGEWRLYWSRD